MRRSRRTPVLVADSIDMDSNDENILENNNFNKLRPNSTEGGAAKDCYKTPSRKRDSKAATNRDEDESYSGVSPPKNKPDPFSPSRLMDQLGIDDTENTNNEGQRRESHKIARTLTKYENARRVLNGAETDILPGRETELAELNSFIFDHLEKSKSGSLYVSGQPGTGKSACLTHILRSDAIASKFVKVYINCTAISTLGSIYYKICEELNLKSASKTEKDCLKAIDKYVCGNHKMVLMILDEIDQLVGKKQSVLYTIFEWPSKPKSKILLIGIANSLDLTDRILTRLNAKCELKPKLMHFSPYSKDQLIAIFNSRLEAAGVLSVFPPVTVQLLAGKVAAVSGDVRRALDIGRRAIELAEQQQRRKTTLDSTDFEIDSKSKGSNVEIVPMGLVATVLNNVYGTTSQNFNSGIGDTFPLQQKILICCVLLILTNDKNKDITIGRLHDVFKRVCMKRNLLAVGQAEFVGLCSLVETRGIIRILSKKEPRLSKILLQWDQEEVSAALADKQLIAAILDDTVCLKK